MADLAFRAGRQPAIGETLIGSGFAMGPGGKGSNQAVAAARAGARVSFISKIGRDPFGQIAVAAWKAEKITPRVMLSETEPTGAAYIFVNDRNGENAIIVVPGAASTITPADVEAASDAIRNARVFVTQLEQPLDAAKRGLEIARAAGVATVFNPAPASGPIPDAIYPLCDYVIPNESEAQGLTGIKVQSADDAKRAGDWLLEKGARRGHDHAWRTGALIPFPRRIELPALLLCRESGGDGGRGRRLRRRLRGGACRRRGTHHVGTLCFRRRRNFGDAARHRAFDAKLFRNRSSAGRGVNAPG